MKPHLALALAIISSAQAQVLKDPEATGEMKQWHTVTVTYQGPHGTEDAASVFEDNRMEVQFTHAGSGESHVVPGFFAADGNASESSAIQGDRWRARFSPPKAGEYSFAARFTQGTGIALTPGSAEGAFPEVGGKFTIAASDKSGRDLRSPDLGLIYHPEGDRYLRASGSGKPFLKGGPGSPENFLAYDEIDGTHDTGGHNKKNTKQFIHKYEPHLQDWSEGDPTWQGGKGKAIIGSLNYIAAQGMRSIYFLTYTIDGGDGKDIWPWANENVRDRFDISKLDQWEIIFSHMQERGLLMNLFLQETENDQGLDGGDLGRTRKLYFREMVARFGHHPGLVWNLGEENTNTVEQVKDFCNYIRALDPYRHPIALHTYPKEKEKRYAPLLGFKNFDIASLQVSRPDGVKKDTEEWLRRSGEAGHQWICPVDEIGPANRGVDPDSREDNNRREIRHRVLWCNLMAGGSGTEHYFGYKNPHADLVSEDWRQRQHAWDDTRHAIEFFEQHLPFDEMQPADELTPATNDWVFTKPGELYAVYIPYGGTTSIDLSSAEGDFEVFWYDPRNGGALQQTKENRTVTAGKTVASGNAPGSEYDDWVLLLRRAAPVTTIRQQAEDYAEQTLDEIRRWEKIEDGDTTYLKLLPDTRASHDDKLIKGENFSNEPGKLAILSYPIEFENPGRYYVWVSAYSQNSEDNGIHVGLDGEWPESGQRMQWCKGKNTWRWDSMQRTEKVHCGVPGQIYLDIKEPGTHTVQFSMREDGFAMDQFLLTTDANFQRPE